jgi:hypothetical protein
MMTSIENSAVIVMRIVSCSEVWSSGFLENFQDNGPYTVSLLRAAGFVVIAVSMTEPSSSNDLAMA